MLLLKLMHAINPRKCTWQYRLQNGGHFVYGRLSKKESEVITSWKVNHNTAIIQEIDEINTKKTAGS